MSALCLYGFFFGTPLCKYAPPFRGLPKIVGSLCSPVHTPLSKTLKTAPGYCVVKKLM